MEAAWLKLFGAEDGDHKVEQTGDGEESDEDVFHENGRESLANPGANAG